MRKFIRSVGFALSGIGYAIRTERHMRIHVVAAVLVIMLASRLSLSTGEWALLLIAITLVISMELINTAIENAVELYSPDRHPLAKAAKDIAAGAVLAATFGAVAIGLLVMGPPLWRLLFI